MHHFVAINDSIQLWRYEQLNAPDSGVLHYINLFKTQHTPFTYVSIKMISQIMQQIPSYAKFMMSRRKEWLWWDQWFDVCIILLYL